ncbi:MAG TPA: DNA-formamidopyrimidine glycosylase family protein [Thermoanaerobaculia bacterium]|jgi:formamidopyrimidine-DNA glycosylase|nr:DNA-formamidopyrimidine glycosylase family protein [Thermoanaerobaculia bacterium]
MPELPEVETYARYFARHALNQCIARVDVIDERILGEVRKEVFVRKLKGTTFQEVRRHGKHFFALATRNSQPATRSATWLHLHFGMTGDLAYYRDIPPRFAKIVFTFDDKTHLAFEDMRLFGLADLVDSPDDFIRERGLGPDPLDRAFTPKRFAALLEGRRGAIKSLLMTQEIIAGLGNLYVDETLYQTSIHPRRPVHRLKEAEVRAVFAAIRRILRESIARQARDAELPRAYLFHHREVGERCPLRLRSGQEPCGGTINRTVVFGRTTYFCAKHQR